MTAAEWIHLYLNLTLIGLVEAVSPLRVAFILLLLSGRRPVIRSIVFIGGVAVFSGIFALFIDETTTFLPDLSNEKSTLSISIGILLSLLLFFVAYRTWRHTPPDEGKVELPNIVGRIMNLALEGNLVGVFLGGVLMQLFSLKSLVLYSAGLKQIVHAGIDFPANAIATLYLIVVMLAEMLVPTVLFAASPANSAHTLARMKEWLASYSYEVLAVAEAALALYLLAESIFTLFA